MVSPTLLDIEPLYLFHNGKFYIFIADDVEKINEYVVLKKTKFTNEVNKCGFPDNRYTDYMRVFQNHHLNIQVIEPTQNSETSDVLPSIIRERYNQIEKYLIDLDINNITPLKAMEILNDIWRFFHDKNC